MNEKALEISFDFFKKCHNKKQKPPIKELKTVTDKWSNELDKNKDFKPSINLGYKLTILERNKISVSRKKLIDNTFDIYFKFHDKFEEDKTQQLKDELSKVPIEKTFPLIFKYEDLYYDKGIYHILNFLKDTQYILSNLNTKKRHYNSRFKIDVLQKRLEDLENIKTNHFLLPKSEYDLKLLNTKEKLLKIFEKNYNLVFAYAHWYNILPTQNMVKDEIFDDSLHDFFNFVNIISVTDKEAIKSLAILIYKIYHGHFESHHIETSVENILRIFFDKEIIEINKNKLNDLQPDTFKIDAKIFRKYSYIHSSFDGILIYGINKENKYFFYKNVKANEFMKLFFQSTSNSQMKMPSLSVYKQLRMQFRKPEMQSYNKEYPEFFENQNINLTNMMNTFFSEMKKSAPDTPK